MGTRNSTMVINDGKMVIAQYGQWDGYPTGQGQTIANFLNRVDIKRFKEQLKKVKETDEKKVTQFLKSIGSENGWMNMDQADLFKKEFPGLSRDEGANILNLIYDGVTYEIRLDPDFKKDTLFCEFWYEINLDKETVTMNGQQYTFDEWKQDGFMEKLEAKERENDE